MCRSQPGWLKTFKSVIANEPIHSQSDRMFNNQFFQINHCAVPIVCDWNSHAPLLLTVCSFPNPGDLCNQLFLTDFLWFILLIRAFNQLLLTNCCFLTCDWNFVPTELYPEILLFNPYRNYPNQTFLSDFLVSHREMRDIQIHYC
jgi:hypothetical protein